MERTYTRFTDVQHVLDYLRTHTHVWYQGPMNHSPMVAEVVQYTVNNRDITRSRMTLWTRETLSFAFRIADHLERFRLPEIARVP